MSQQLVHEQVVRAPEAYGAMGAGSRFEPLLGITEAAKLLGVHPKTLQAMAREGTVPCIRMGKYWRFRESSLDVWVRERLELENQSRRVQ